MLSAYLEKEKAEELTNKIVCSIVEAEIKVHEDFIEATKHRLEDVKKKLKEYEYNFFSTKYERGIHQGAKITYEGRILSHEHCIRDLREDLEILKLNLI